MFIQLLSFSGIANAIFYLAFGGVVLLRGRRSSDIVVFSLFCFSVAWWGFGYWLFFMKAMEGNYTSALFWDRFGMIGSAYIPVFLFHWTVEFLELRKGRRYITFVLGLVYLLIAIFTLFGFSRFFVEDIVPKLFLPYWPNPGFLYTINIFVCYIGLILLSIFLLYQKFRTIRSKEERHIFFLVLAGLSVSAIGGATNFPLWYDIPLLPYGTFMVPVMLFFFGYAIIKRQFLNVKAIAAEFITFLIWIFLFLRIILAPSTQTAIIDGIFFVLTVIFGSFLVRSVNNEVRRREELSILNVQLKELNDRLEQKVKEQTEDIRRSYKVEKQAKEELKELDKAKTGLVRTTQEHIGEPLSVIESSLAALLHKKEGEAYTAGDVSAIKSGCSANEALTLLINRLLEISQMEVGKSILKKKDVNMNALTDDVLKELDAFICEKRLIIKKDLPGTSSQVLSLDEARFRDALLNILDNAVRYTPQGGTIRITGECDTHPIEKTKLYRLTIQDTGIGMTKEEQEELFTQAFSRSAEAKELNTTGRGIGLMLTRQIIEAHGGTIRAESEGKGTGTRFVVEVPVEGEAGN